MSSPAFVRLFLKSDIRQKIGTFDCHEFFNSLDLDLNNHQSEDMKIRQNTIQTQVLEQWNEVVGQMDDLVAFQPDGTSMCYPALSLVVYLVMTYDPHEPYVSLPDGRYIHPESLVLLRSLANCAGSTLPSTAEIGNLAAQQALLDKFRKKPTSKMCSGFGRVYNSICQTLTWSTVLRSIYTLASQGAELANYPKYPVPNEEWNMLRASTQQIMMENHQDQYQDQMSTFYKQSAQLVLGLLFAKFVAPSVKQVISRTTQKCTKKESDQLIENYYHDLEQMIAQRKK